MKVVALVADSHDIARGGFDSRSLTELREHKWVRIPASKEVS